MVIISQQNYTNQKDTGLGLVGWSRVQNLL